MMAQGAKQAATKPDTKADGKPAEAKQPGAGHPATGRGAKPGTVGSDTASTDAKPEAQPAESGAKDAKASAQDGAAQGSTPPAAGSAKPDGTGQAAVQPAPRAADTLPAVPTTAVAMPAAPPTAPQATMQAVPLQHVAVTIAARAKAGESRFEIRLDPPDLGRIDVSLQVDRTGTASATLTVERADTLSLLQGDQRSLERALADAGFKSDGASLQFSLRDGGQGMGQGAGQNAGQNTGQGWQEGARTRRLLLPDTGGPAAPAALARYAAPALRLGGVDISI